MRSRSTLSNPSAEPEADLDMAPVERRADVADPRLGREGNGAEERQDGEHGGSHAPSDCSRDCGVKLSARRLAADPLSAPAGAPAQ
jgi:hypothetical protein